MLGVGVRVAVAADDGVHGLGLGPGAVGVVVLVVEAGSAALQLQHPVQLQLVQLVYILPGLRAAAGQALQLGQLVSLSVKCVNLLRICWCIIN